MVPCICIFLMIFESNYCIPTTTFWLCVATHIIFLSLASGALVSASNLLNTGTSTQLRGGKWVQRTAGTLIDYLLRPVKNCRCSGISKLTQRCLPRTNFAVDTKLIHTVINHLSIHISSTSSMAITL